MIKKKYKIIALAVLVLLIASQWVLISLTYARKLPDSFSLLLADVYKLKAGTVSKDGETLNIYLSDYFFNKNIAREFLEAQSAKAQEDGHSDYQLPDDEQVDGMIWEKLLRDAWLKKISQTADISVQAEDVEIYLSQAGDRETLEAEAQKEFRLPFSAYQTAVIEPFILESKVYDYLLGNFNDAAGAQKAQKAYEALESGRDFVEVAQEFSDDPVYVESSLWLSEEDLVGFSSPIKNLEVGKFSEIVIAPGVYIIWYLKDMVEEKDQTKVWEIRAIFINAKSIDSFFNDYMTSAEVKKLY